MYLTTDKAVAKPPAVVDSSLGWSVRLAAMAMMSKSGDQVCPVIMKVSDFNRSKETEEIWRSDSFYTHDNGYNMCMHVYPAGHHFGKGNHLSWCLFLMKGPHDDKLTWPLKEKFEIKLLNQISDSMHCSTILTYDVIGNYNSRVIEGKKAKRGWGRPQFISHEGLYKITTTCQFLKDDSLF